MNKKFLTGLLLATLALSVLELRSLSDPVVVARLNAPTGDRLSYQQQLADHFVQLLRRFADQLCQGGCQWSDQLLVHAFRNG